MLHNLTDWQAELFENWLPNKQKCLTLVVKQSYEFDDNGEVFSLAQSEPIVMADEMRGEPTASSLKEVNETAPIKNGFEFYGNLTAYPPKSKRVKVIEVNVSLMQSGEVIADKTLRVTGDRKWQSSLLGTRASDPDYLSPTELSYENTYGGFNVEKPLEIYELNPVGTGFKLKKAKGTSLPKVEYPKSILKHYKNQIQPASYGAIPMFWQPRLDFLPDIDEQALMAGEYPYKENVKPELYNCAPEDQQIEVQFNELFTLSLKGVIPNRDYLHKTEIALPFDKPRAAFIQGDEQIDVDLACDTLVLNPDANSFHLIWRKSIKAEKINDFAEWLVEPPSTEQSPVGKNV